MFDSLWREIVARNVNTVQNREELEHVFNLMQGCESYLEIGTAEGNSLYVLSHALKPGSPITYIDLGEKHTATPREEILNRIDNPVTEIHGDSNAPEIVAKVAGQKFDVVLIDAGHSYENVRLDAMNYGPLATKYVIFHDVTMPEVRKAFDEYAVGKNSYTFILSENFGYGVIKV